jgi:hypothetical protein
MRATSNAHSLVRMTATSVAIGNDGLPVVSYFDQTNAMPKVAKCTDASCSTNTLIRPIAPALTYYTSITIGADGIPVMSFAGGASYDLRVATCGNPFCFYWRR